MAPGHTTWFFETFLLEPTLAGYDAFDPASGTSSTRTTRRSAPGIRGRTRAALAADRRRGRARTARTSTTRWRSCSTTATPTRGPTSSALVELGLHHEQQHQELLLMDIKHVLSCNPLDPCTSTRRRPRVTPARPLRDASSTTAGSSRSATTATRLRVRQRVAAPHVFLEPFRIADRLVTAGEWLAFIADGGYERPSSGSPTAGTRCRSNGWNAPLYWRDDGADGWTVFTLDGRRPVDPNEPVVHVSHYEADAFARWAGARLPTEFEWEHAFAPRSATGGLADSHPITRGCIPPPRPATAGSACRRSATCGSGPRARTCPTRASNPRPARSVSTTASS